MKKNDEKKSTQRTERKEYQPPRVRDEKRLIQDALASGEL